MPIEVVQGPDASRLRLTGVLDIRTAAELKTAALAVLGAPGGVEVDLGEAKRLDTAAAQVLLALARSLAASGRPMAITGARAAVRGTCERVGLIAAEP